MKPLQEPQFKDKYEFIKSCYSGELSTEITKSYNLDNENDARLFLAYVLEKNKKYRFYIDLMTVYRAKFIKKEKK